MKVALLIPAWRPEELFPAKTAGSQINYWQPLGTLYVAAMLKQAGIEVRFINGAFSSREQILAELSSFAPRLVGIYATAFGWPRALQAAADIRERLPASFICAGGPYPIAMQTQALSAQDSCLDAVVTGEGEHTLLEAAQRLARGESLRGVRGLIVNEGGELIVNDPRPLIEDLDTLPFPARELLGDEGRCLPPPATYRRAPVAVMITSRGCNRRCIYCFQTDKHRQAGKRGIRFRSVDNVIAEIRQLLHQGYREIKFIDDTLAADYDRLMHLTREIRRQGLDFSWFASVCSNQVDKPLLRAMKAAGCWAVLIGAESGVQRNLNTLRKAITLDHVRAAVKAAKEVGLFVQTPFIIGIPGENREDVLKTIDFAVELDPDIANFHALTAFPGTELYDRQDKFGRVRADLSLATYQGANFEPHTLTRAQIHELRQLALRRFYSRPRFLLRRLLALRSRHDLKVAITGLRSLWALWRERRLFARGPGQAADAGSGTRRAIGDTGPG